MKVAVIDYGMGNIRSVAKALERVGADVTVVSSEFAPLDFDKVVLPGVGAFGDTVEGLISKGLWKPLKDVLDNGQPYLGICLGMQILCTESEESPGVLGLGLIKTKVKRFVPERDIKVPHMGWSQVKIKKRDCLFREIEDDSFFYFCHSFYVPINIGDDYILSTCDYGIDFVSSLKIKNAWGVQFHPEKSQTLGLKLLEDFVYRC